MWWLGVVVAGFLLPDAMGQGATDDDRIVQLPPWIIEAPAEGVLPANLSPGLAVVGVGESAFAPHATLRSALGLLPGLILQDSFGGIDPPRISVRGSGLQSAPVSRGIVLRLDGLPLNAADGSFNSALLETALAGFFVSRRGIADPVSATMALGGSIELGLPRDTDGRRMNVVAGSNGFRRGVVAGDWTASKSEVWVGASHVQSDGFRGNNTQDRTTLVASLRHRATETTTVGVSLFATNPRLDVPGPLTRAAALNTPEAILPLVAIDKPRRETDVLRIGFELDWQRDDSALRAATGLMWTDDMFRQLRANGISRTSADDVTVLLEGRRRWERHELRGGFHGVFGERDTTRTVNSLGADGPVFGEHRLRADTLTAWIDDTVRLRDDLALQVGVSLGSAKRHARSTAAVASTQDAGEVESDDVAPRIGLTWRPRKEFVVFGTWSRGFEPPTFDDILAVAGSHPNLRTEFRPLAVQRADVFEVGLRGGSEHLRFEVTAYHADWRHELLRLADANGSPRGTVNAAPTTHRGIETSVRWRVLRGQQTLDCVLSHTWSTATFDNDPVFGRNRIAGLPRQAGGGEVRFADRRGPFAALGAAWIGGETFADHGNRLSYDGHFVVNARAGWRDPRGWTLYLDVSNAFDAGYIASTTGVLDLARVPQTTTLFLPSAPRSVQVGIEWRW